MSAVLARWFLLSAFRVLDLCKFKYIILVFTYAITNIYKYYVSADI